MGHDNRSGPCAPRVVGARCLRTQVTGSCRSPRPSACTTAPWPVCWGSTPCTRRRPRPNASTDRPPRRLPDGDPDREDRGDPAPHQPALAAACRDHQRVGRWPPLRDAQILARHADPRTTVDPWTPSGSHLGSVLPCSRWTSWFLADATAGSRLRRSQPAACITEAMCLNSSRASSAGLNSASRTPASVVSRSWWGCM